MTHEFDLEAEYTTRDGSRVIIYTVEAGGEFPIHAGVIAKGGDRMYVQPYSLEGLVPGSDNNHPKDIIIEEEIDIEEIDITDGELVMCNNKSDIVPMFGIYVDKNTALVNDGNGGVIEKTFEFITSFDDDIDGTMEEFMLFRKDSNASIDILKYDDADDEEYAFPKERQNDTENIIDAIVKKLSIVVASKKA